MSEPAHVLSNLPRISAALPKRQALPYEPVCALFRRHLREQVPPQKFTPERAMMLDAVLRKTKLFDPEELVADLKALGHRASRATVYRTLVLLQEAGIIKQVFFDNRQSYYEVIVGRETSDYLICVNTGRVIPFRSEKLRELIGEICQQHGYEPISHQFHVFGVSPDGAEPTGSAPPPAVG